MEKPRPSYEFSYKNPGEHLRQQYDNSESSSNFEYFNRSSTIIAAPGKDNQKPIAIVTKDRLDQLELALLEEPSNKAEKPAITRLAVGFKKFFSHHRAIND